MVAKVLLFSAVVFAVLAGLSWTGTLEIDESARSVFALSFGICAAADVLIGFALWVRSHNI